MSFYVSRAVASAKDSQDRADIFARGDHAVLAVADGAGGIGDGGRAADLFIERVRDAVLDTSFDLLTPNAWHRLFADVDADLRSIGESTALVVVLAPGMLLCTTAGDSEAWIVHAHDVERLTGGSNRARLGSGRAKTSSVTRRELDGRLVVATDGLFSHVPEHRILEVVRGERFGRIADALVESARLPSGDLCDDIAVLVAER
ncbi:MAG: hypothetical protein BGO98_33340 [Myxococcales bacterium 68-20]|nr:MAG: hypothetical protein BGO98_33340 [Myxococcales bacterium 68-20]